MGVMSIVLAANSDTKLSPVAQICSAYSWINVGGKLLKLVALKRLFAEEKDIKRKLQKLLVEGARVFHNARGGGYITKVMPDDARGKRYHVRFDSGEVHCYSSSSLMSKLIVDVRGAHSELSGRLPQHPAFAVAGIAAAFLRAASADNSEPDAHLDRDGTRRSHWRHFTRYGAVNWLDALLHGKTRGARHSDFELVNAAILEETRRRDATKSGKVIVEANHSARMPACVLLDTTSADASRVQRGIC